MSTDGWHVVALSDIAKLTVGFVGTMATEYEDDGVIFLRSQNVLPFKIDLNDVKYISPEFNQKISKSILNAGDVVIVRTGKPGACAVIPQTKESWNCSDLVIIRPNTSKIHSLFLATYINTLASGHINANLVGAVQQHFNVGAAKRIQMPLPPLEEQKRIVSIVGNLNDKIELNNQINKNLEAQAQAIFKSWFVDFEPFQDGEFVDSELGRIPKGWRVGKAEDFYNISIGKTPPRKEPQWFTKNHTDIKWLSISDMGKDGVYSLNTAERLTSEAIEKFKIRTIPSGTVVLSFKLTVGRIAITDEPIVSNEAIAHFTTSNETIREFTYLYLRKFDYNLLGNTSSIATAVNSKTIKAMPFLMPSKNTIQQFHTIAQPIFETLKWNEQQTQTLTALRDTLLPKLMSGELRVPLEVE